MKYLFSLSVTEVIVKYRVVWSMVILVGTFSSEITVEPLIQFTCIGCVACLLSQLEKARLMLQK